MRLRDWRDGAPRKDSMGPKVLSVVDAALDMLGAEPNPDCWVAWGDDPAVRYTMLVPIPAGLLNVNVRVNVPGEGPRAQGKLVRWNRVQSGELSVEVQGGHRLINFQIDNNVLHGKDESADVLSEFVLVVYDAIDGRARVPGRRRASSPNAGRPVGPPDQAAGPAVAGAQGDGRADRRGHLRPRRGARGLGDLVGRGPPRVRRRTRPSLDP